MLRPTTLTEEEMVTWSSSTRQVSTSTKLIRPPQHCNSLLQFGPAQGNRGHKRRLSGQRTTSCVQRENFFRSDTTISAESVNQFKNQYDEGKGGPFITHIQTHASLSQPRNLNNSGPLLLLLIPLTSIITK